MRIYLAGKVSGGNDWRNQLLVRSISDVESPYGPGVDGSYGSTPYLSVSTNQPRSIHAFPVIPRAVLGMLDYTGPYFLDVFGGHGHPGTEATHRLLEVTSTKYTNHVPGTDLDEQQAVVRLCLQAIARSDVVFAWLDQPNAYATLVELGYAYALRIPIWVALHPELEYELRVYDPPDEMTELTDLWFLLQMCQYHTVAPDARQGLKSCLHDAVMMS